ncbi:copper resistance CopC/CopD family protein [Micromonospora zhanjiangensis]|uniref:Copper resistance CopC/CopD family protein n=1 Tax=Micromonospora zhanjiangensis TaxID=1522057 RepID=A0ABV8KNA3_9ACTN
MSTMTAANRRWLARAAAGFGLLLAALGMLLGPAGPASAHAVLVGSTPANGSVLPSAPTEVVLIFSESVNQVPDKIRVLGPDGSRVDRGQPKFSGTTVTIAVDGSAPQGTFLVSYRVISADSHPVAGGLTYSVGAPSTPPTDDANATRVDATVSAAVSVAKYLGYAGLVLLIGPVLVLSLLWPRRLPRRGPARLVWTGLGLVTVATVAGLWLQMPYTNGGGLFDVTGSELQDVLASTFGAVHLVRLGVLLAAAILLRPLLEGRAGRSDNILLAVLLAAGLATWPLAGHAAAAAVPAVSVVVDVVHLAAMAVWLGGLVMLVGFLLRQTDERELGAILPIWSRWAATAVSALVLAGTVQGLLEIGTPKALLDTTYGRLLLAKIGLLAVALVAAAYARQLVRRRVAADAAALSGHGPSTDEPAADLPTEEPTAEAAGVAGRRWLRRSVWVELTVTAVILAVSATLVQTTPARTAVANSATGGRQGPFTASATSSLYRLEVQIDPAQVGNNTIHLYAYTPDNQPQRVVEWKATAALPDKGVEPVDIPLLPLVDYHATGEISLPTAGQWQLKFTLRTSDIDQATVTTTVPIK